MDTLIGFAAIGFVLYLAAKAIEILRRRFCDLCGASASCRSVQGFTLCKKCARVAETSTTPIGDLIAQGMASRNMAEAAKRSGVGCLGAVGWLLAAGLVAFGVVVASRSGVLVKPTLPIVVTVRDSALGEGKVAILRNQCDRQLTVTASVTRDQQNSPRTWPITVPPNGSSEFGWAQGWAFKHADELLLSHPEYRAFTWVVD